MGEKELKEIRKKWKAKGKEKGERATRSGGKEGEEATTREKRPKEGRKGVRGEETIGQIEQKADMRVVKDSRS